MQSLPVLHYSHGIPKLRYSIRIDREIRKVYLKPVNKVLVDSRDGTHFLLTKGVCAKAVQYRRVTLQPYVGNWPRCALIWARLVEVVRG